MPPILPLPWERWIFAVRRKDGEGCLYVVPFNVVIRFPSQSADKPQTALMKRLVKIASDFERSL